MPAQNPGSGCATSGIPPGYVAYTSPATFTNTTINNGMWVNISGAGCIVFSGTVTVNGGITVIDGCIDNQGTLIVNGDVFLGSGGYTQDQTNNPTVIQNTLTVTSPAASAGLTFDIREYTGIDEDNLQWPSPFRRASRLPPSTGRSGPSLAGVILPEVGCIS